MEVVVSKICIDNHIGGGVVRSFCLLSVYRGNGCGSGVADAGRSGSDSVVSDFKDSAASGNSVYRNRNEYSRADHAAALYE